MKKKKQILSEEKKAQRKIYMAEYYQKNKAKNNITSANWYQKNKEYSKQQMKEWHEANPNYSKEWPKANPDKVKAKAARFKEKNPDYTKEWHEANPGYSKEHHHKHDLGYWIVYIIHDYNGRGDEYCGMTQNIYMRMSNHKSLGRLNTDTYTIVKECDTLEDALELESAVHNFGYHGSASTESGK